MSDDFTDEDFAPPGHTWTKDDELAFRQHRQALAGPVAVKTNQSAVIFPMTETTKEIHDTRNLR